MLPFSRPVQSLVRERYSCRTYEKRPLAPEQADQLTAFVRSIRPGPLGATLRFEVVAAGARDPQALRGLGTYGLIRNPAAFIIGAVGPGIRNLEDYGYGIEAAVLYATDLGLGSCWLGGNFTRSTFAQKIRATREEQVPAVVALGYASQGNRSRDLIRLAARSDSRLPWDALFTASGLQVPLSKEAAGAYAEPLEMVRLAPSASNRQPWRVVRDGSCFHFYLRRSLPRAPGLAGVPFLGLADLQRVDIGIAMCHFHLTASELGLTGAWTLQEPAFERPDARLEYIVTWMDQSGVRGTLAQGTDSPAG